MRKINLENGALNNLAIAVVFFLVVAAAGHAPLRLSTGMYQAKKCAADNSEAVPPPPLRGEYCSLADFRQLANNIRSLRCGISSQRATELAKYIWLAGTRFDCDPKLIAALIQVESSFFSRARSQKGAVGLMQLRPFVARELASRLKTAWRGVQSLHNPEINILMGTCYLATLIRDFPDLPTALAAYNCGPSYVRRRLRRGQRLPTRYSVKIMTIYQSFTTNQS